MIVFFLEFDPSSIEALDQREICEPLLESDSKTYGTTAASWMDGCAISIASSSAGGTCASKLFFDQSYR
jgi:hypothetical protein